MATVGKLKILIDTDLGDDTDDAAALIMALNSPELDIVGITTVFHNTRKRAEMVQDLCRFYQREDIPVCPGFKRPLIEDVPYEESPIQYEILRKDKEFHLYQEMDAADFLINAVKNNPDVTIVEMGAMTNLAIAFYRNPEIMENVKIIAMGGTFTSSFPEWNIKCDPEAARIVMDKAKHLTMIGLDVTKYCQIPTEFLDEICKSDNERMCYYRNGVSLFQKKTNYDVTFHDVLLMVALIKPDIVTFKNSDFTVELGGSYTRGSIVLKTNGYEMDEKTDRDFQYATRFDRNSFMELLKQRLF